MKFNDELRHNLLFQQVGDIYGRFDNFKEYNPSVCDPKDAERIRELSNRLGHKFQSILEDLNELENINVDSYGC